MQLFNRNFTTSKSPHSTILHKQINSLGIIMLVSLYDDTSLFIDRGSINASIIRHSKNNYIVEVHFSPYKGKYKTLITIKYNSLKLAYRKVMHLIRYYAYLLRSGYSSNAISAVEQHGDYTEILRQTAYSKGYNTIWTLNRRKENQHTFIDKLNQNPEHLQIFDINALHNNCKIQIESSPRYEYDTQIVGTIYDNNGNILYKVKNVIEIQPDNSYNTSLYDDYPNNYTYITGTSRNKKQDAINYSLYIISNLLGFNLVQLGLL